MGTALSNFSKVSLSACLFLYTILRALSLILFTSALRPINTISVACKWGLKVEYENDYLRRNLETSSFLSAARKMPVIDSFLTIGRNISMNSREYGGAIISSTYSKILQVKRLFVWKYTRGIELHNVTVKLRFLAPSIGIAELAKR